MAMQFNKPKFDWEAKDHLSELEQFKQECSVLFQGPLSEMKDAQKAGLIVNWIGSSMHYDPAFYGNCIRQTQNSFDNLEKIFRPESNQTLSQIQIQRIETETIPNLQFIHV